MSENFLKGVKNVEFTGHLYCKETGRELPVFTLNEPSVEEWNRRAKIQNTKMFVQIMKRQPENYQEVLNWVYSLIPENEENQPAGNELAFHQN
ncbi:hypothetical protein NP92_14515 [Anoxybacillus gonensis]|uniref:Phage protein n=1 Tax=Anoxybacillus gonensis TaxID=198467 RepID=A0AAW7THA3_9BACL|nr:hypothetical protein [Anoxybacillus gonensis]KGP59365.1 hypothetical protein NP92_14515 [Anoxybacillus gonensis]MDO0878788.1 hypothetical protein [Anoxybacillus gonensis]